MRLGSFSNKIQSDNALLYKSTFRTKKRLTVKDNEKIVDSVQKTLRMRHIGKGNGNINFNDKSNMMRH